MRIVALVALVAFAGCAHFETDLGPAFAHAPPQAETGTIYFYRPTALMMARRIAHVYVDGDERLVLTGGYVALRVPPGHHIAYAYTTPEWQYYVTYGFGPTRWRGEVAVDVPAGGEAFVRIASPIGSVEMTVTDGADAGDTHLSPGGAPR